MATLTLTTWLPCSAEQCLEAVKRPALLQYIAAPLLHFTAAGREGWPEVWALQSYTARISLFGFIPLGRQQLNLSAEDFSTRSGHPHYQLRDNGNGSWMRQWDHRIHIEAESNGCRYTDQLTVSAGWLTLPVWLFAQCFYRHRQRRWRKLVQQDFAPLKP